MRMGMLAFQLCVSFPDLIDRFAEILRNRGRLKPPSGAGIEFVVELKRGSQHHIPEFPRLLLVLISERRFSAAYCFSLLIWCQFLPPVPHQAFCKKPFSFPSLFHFSVLPFLFTVGQILCSRIVCGALWDDTSNPTSILPQTTHSAESKFSVICPEKLVY